jgi:hypothetical protein
MTCDQQRFERDTAEHKMTVIRDNGVDRHLMFRKPDGSSYWFEILTWPGALCIRGDCGTYVFSRLTDMFEFFRTDDRGDPSKLYINTGYWCEKLQATDCDGYGKGAARAFSGERFEARVKENFDSYFEDSEIDDEDRASIWDEIDSEVLNYARDGDGHMAFNRLYEFHNSDHPRLFEDCCEWFSSCEEYTFHFLWNLYAIAWAIRQYDAARAAAVPANTPEAA